MDHDVLAAILRRSGRASKRRILMLFLAMKRGKWVGTESPLRPSTMDIIRVLLYLAKAPRFLFACGDNGAVLRSADRGRSWRKLKLPTAVATGLPSADEDEAQTSDLNRILQLLPSQQPMSDSEEDEQQSTNTVDRPQPQGAASRAAAALSKSATVASTSSFPELLGLDCWGDTVVAVGRQMYVAASTDRGQAFQAIVPAESTKTALRDVKLCSRFTAVAYGAKSLFRIDIPHTTRTPDGPQAGTVVTMQQFESQIGLLQLMRRGSEASHWLVGLLGRLLFVSLDGELLLSVSHGLGIIRSVADLSPLYSTAELETLRDASAAGLKRPSDAGDRRYTYAVATPMSQSLQLERLGFTASQLACYAVLATNGSLVPYDCTAVMTIYVRHHGSEAGAESSIVVDAQRIVYVPFIQSGLHEKVGLLAWRAVEKGKSQVRWLRSTAEGLALSVDDGATFGTPAQALTGTLVWLGSDTIVACNLKKAVVVTEDGGSTWRLSVLPSELRVATLHTIAVME